MLGRQGPLDRRAGARMDGGRLGRAFPAPRPPHAGAAAGHLDALLAAGFLRYPLDGALVDEARRVFSPPADGRAGLFAGCADGPDAPPWAPADPLGPAGQRLFVRLRAGHSPRRRSRGCSPSRACTGRSCRGCPRDPRRGLRELGAGAGAPAAAAADAGPTRGRRVAAVCGGLPASGRRCSIAWCWRPSAAWPRLPRR